VRSVYSGAWPGNGLRLLVLAILLGQAPLHAQYRVTPWPHRVATPSLDFLVGPQFSKGLPTLLNFWATWCEPCKLEMPSLDVLAEWEGGAHLQIVAIDVRETSARAERFLAQRNLQLRVIQDPDAQTAKRFRVFIYPTTILIDAKGQARWTIEGPVDWTSQEARGWIDALSRP